MRGLYQVDFSRHIVLWRHPSTSESLQLDAYCRQLSPSFLCHIQKFHNRCCHFWEIRYGRTAFNEVKQTEYKLNKYNFFLWIQDPKYGQVARNYPLAHFCKQNNFIFCNDMWIYYKKESSPLLSIEFVKIFNGLLWFTEATKANWKFPSMRFVISIFLVLWNKNFMSKIFIYCVITPEKPALHVPPSL